MRNAALKKGAVESDKDILALSASRVWISSFATKYAGRYRGRSDVLPLLVVV
jgi:hypothetical protein